MVLGGFAYWFWPAAGFAVASQIFGWLLILAGIVQLCVSAGVNRPRGWGWWLAGGVIDMFVGFMLVRSVILSEIVFPYFLSIVFIFWGYCLDHCLSWNQSKPLLVDVSYQWYPVATHRFLLP